MSERSLRLFGVALVATLTFASPVMAQRAADLRPVGVVQLRESRTPRPSMTPVAAGSRRHHVWPWLVLGGAVAGASTIVVMGVKNCDINCQDDGGWGQAPYFVAIGAAIGAAVGGALGIIIDSSRGAAAGQR